MTTNKLNTVKISVRHGARKAWEKQSQWQQNANGFRVCLKYQGRKLFCDFWQGRAIQGEPTAAGVLECLLSDASGADETFTEWCGNLGYDDDSREAMRTYRQVQRQTAKLRELLGADYETFLYADRD